jgi:hypothetical protein
MRGWLRSQEHLTEEELFLVFDAGMPREKSERIRIHLGQCWECKTKLEQFEAARSDYMFFKSKFQESEDPPPSNWTAFQSRLHRLAEDLDVRDRSSSWTLRWESLRRMVEAPYSPVVRVSIGLLVLAIVVFVLVVRSNIPSVSAHDVVRRAVTAERSEIAGLQRPVIYQKLAIKVGQHQIARTIYRDVNARRHVDQVDRAAGKADTNEAAPEIAQVQGVFSVAKLDWEAPLSPSRFEEWTSSAHVTDEEVVRGSEVTEIRAIATDGPIREASISFRNTDFHPVAESLSLADKEYVEIAELDYRVVELSQLRPDVFDSPVLTASPALKAAVAHVSLPNPVDLELNVLGRLDRLDALLKDQIRVSRTGDGGVLIEGIVQTSERQSELRRALASLSAVHGVQSDIHTTAEAEANEPVAGPLKLDSVDVLPHTAPGQESVRRYLMSQGFVGTRLDSEAQTYTYRIFDHSNEALVNAVLVKQIANSFTESEIREMTQENREKWLDLIRRHADAVTQELVDLRSELQPVFAPRQIGDRPITQRVDLVAAADDLSAAVAAIDKDVGKSLAMSPSESNESSLETEAFWGAFSLAEERAYAVLEAARK